EQDERTKDMEKYVQVFRCSPNIYNLLGAKISPEEYMLTVETSDYDGVERIAKNADYNYIYYANGIEEVDLEKQDYVFIVSSIYEYTREYVEENGYKGYQYGDYYILLKKNN